MRTGLRNLIGVFLMLDVRFAYSWTTSEVFAKYPNTFFIETGSYLGDGINAALQSGFENIYSIEIKEEFYNHCVFRFILNSELSGRIELFFGNSAEILLEILEKVNVPATFWLDGHYSGEGTGKGAFNTPLLEELEHIAKHHIKNHTILIDDVRCFGTSDFDFLTIEEVKEKLLSINPSYEFSFENGYINNDVLVARVPISH